MQLIVIIPIIGVIVLIVCYCQDRKFAGDQYGASPKYRAEGETGYAGGDA